jgi:hypothetical protein
MPTWGSPATNSNCGQEQRFPPKRWGCRLGVGAGERRRLRTDHSFVGSRSGLARPAMTTARRGCLALRHRRSPRCCRRTALLVRGFSWLAYRRPSVAYRQPGNSRSTLLATPVRLTAGPQGNRVHGESAKPLRLYGRACCLGAPVLLASTAGPSPRRNARACVRFSSPI